MGQVLQIFPEKQIDVDLLLLNVARLCKQQNLDPITQKPSITVWDDEICLELPIEANVEEFKQLLNEGYAPARVEEYEDGT